MSVEFPSVEFFNALQKGLENDPATRSVEPSEAYCGFAVGDQLFVFEFDGRACVAVIRGGNPIDLDFVISGPIESWSLAIAKAGGRRLADLIQTGALSIESDEGHELAVAALPLLQIFIDQSQTIEMNS